jgi:hypothetical protein
MASALTVAKPRARRRRTPVDASPDGAAEASSPRNDDVDVSANPDERIGLAKVGRSISAGAHDGARTVELAVSALISSLHAN